MKLPKFKEAKVSSEIVKTILKELRRGPKTRYELRFRARPLGDVQLRNVLKLLAGIGLVQAQRQPYRGKVSIKTQNSLSPLGREVLRNARAQNKDPSQTVDRVQHFI